MGKWNKNKEGSKLEEMLINHDAITSMLLDDKISGIVPEPLETTVLIQSSRMPENYCEFIPAYQ